MKNTALLIDTNVVLDWILSREPFKEQAQNLMRYCMRGFFKGHIAAHSFVNIFFIARHKFNVMQRREILLMLFNYFSVVGINDEAMYSALTREGFKDLEDDLQIECAKIARVDFIITRDAKGFKNSDVPALSPEEFLRMVE